MSRTDRFTRLDQTRHTLLKNRGLRTKAGRRKPHPNASDQRLRIRSDAGTVAAGLRVASQHGREDLRAEYLRLANLFAGECYAMEFEGGDGI